MSLRRSTLAAALSAAVCLVLATRVFISFEVMRLKLVEKRITPANGIVRIDATSPGVVFEPPHAVIARVRNDAPSPERLTIRLNGDIVCAPSVSAQTSIRIDCNSSHQWSAKDHGVLTITGAGANWSLEYLELATHHGATRHYDLIVIPGSSTRYKGISALWIATAFVLIAGLLLGGPQPPVRRIFRAVYRVSAAAVALLLTSVFLSRLVSPYLVLLSARSFVACACVLFAPHLWATFRRGWTFVRVRGWSGFARCAIATLVVIMGYGAVFSNRLTTTYHGNYSGFLQIARSRFDQNPALNNRDDVRASLVLADGGGYDGQFSYFEIYDPFLRHYRDHPAVYRQFIDAPPYRFGRIGYSVLAKALSLDQWQWYPATMVWLVFSSIALCAVILGCVASSIGATPAWGAVVVLIPGFWQSLLYGLPEPIAAATLLAGYLCLSYRRWYSAGALFAASLLIRETGLIFVLVVAAANLRTDNRRDVLRWLFMPLGALLVWHVYVGWILFNDWGAEAFVFHPHDFDLPFSGIAHLWASIGRGEYYPAVSGLSRAGIWYPILLTAAAVFACVASIAAPSAASITAVFYAVIAICLNFDNIWVHVANAERGTFELMIMLALVSLDLPCATRLTQWLVVAFWAFAAIYLCWGALDAEFFRIAISSLIPDAI